MDVFELLKLVFIPLALGMTGYQLHVDRSQNRKIEELMKDKVTEERVRSILNDKAEALHLADRNSQERLDRVEDRINKIDEKLDRILEMLARRK